jgi:hypothetical protein
MRILYLLAAAETLKMAVRTTLATSKVVMGVLQLTLLLVV